MFSFWGSNWTEYFPHSGSPDLDDWTKVRFPCGLPCGSILVVPNDKKWLLDSATYGIDQETWGVVYAEPNLHISDLKLNPLGYTPLYPKDKEWLLANVPSE